MPYGMQRIGSGEMLCDTLQAAATTTTPVTLSGKRPKIEGSTEIV